MSSKIRIINVLNYLLILMHRYIRL